MVGVIPPVAVSDMSTMPAPGDLPPVIAAHGLSVGHRGQAVLSSISLRLEAGRILCLLGPNGAGKTTLFRSLMGLLPPISGEVLLGGLPLSSLPRRKVAHLLAYVPQALEIPFAFTAFDLVLMGASAHLAPLAMPGATEKEAAIGALRQLGIADLAGARINSLSGGQRQMILIARALAQGAKAIVMDEPVASLDFANRVRVAEAIAALASQGIAVILSTHDPDLAAHLGHDAILVGRGRVLAHGPVRSVLTGETLSALYGTKIRREELPGGGLHFRA